MKKVFYSPVLGVIQTVAGAFVLVVHFMIGGVGIQLFTGSILTLLGILYLVNPIVEYNDEEFRIKNPLGMILKKYSFSESQFEIKNGKVYTDGKRVALQKLFSKSSQFEDLMKTIESKIK